ncbi:MAG: type 1 glutamine amidotransferase domain-containing protein [Bacteriovoracaceae bacterium]|jgi:protease I|nr:type 1 glutamine amidotransferase domain-containing protein [Bacteriovoracaceae bacterium]
MKKLKNKTIAVLATDGFEHSELTEPVQAFKDAGAKVHILSPSKKEIKSWSHGQWKENIEVDKDISKASSEDYHGLLIPGGVINPDILRKNKQAVDFVKSFNTGKTRKPIAAICHGPWMLVEAGIAEGKTMTSYESIKTDIINAGAKWVDKEVVCDNGIVTSRSPNDMNAFISKAIEEFAEGDHIKRR